MYTCRSSQKVSAVHKVLTEELRGSNGKKNRSEIESTIENYHLL